MVLQALNRYYDILQEDEDANLPKFGYSAVGVSFALNISSEGELLDILPMFDTVQRGKKEVEVPRRMIVPTPFKKSGISPKSNFLCENSAFMLGISSKDFENPEYSSKRYNTFKSFHQDLIVNVDTEVAKAVLAFLNRHKPHKAREHPVIVSNLEPIIAASNLVFIFKGEFVHENSALKEAWEEFYQSQDAVEMQCLVTGEKAPIARLHPSLKGIRGAKSMGASLVSFNERSYESFNRTKEQGTNSPVSKKAVFTYTSILNYLLSDANPNRKLYLGDTTVVYWAESENRGYENVISRLFFPDSVDAASSSVERKQAEEALASVAEKIQQAGPLDLDDMVSELGDENPRFYVLGLAPNAARASVRFFITDPFQTFADHIMAHYQDMEIEKEYPDQPEYLSVWNILNETVSKKSRDKNAAPLLAGSVFRSILMNSPYPAALYYAIINRVRADMDDKEKRIKKINYPRAAIIKAYLIRKYRNQLNHPFQEVLIMSLNEQSKIPAYLLGRLFAVLEKVQREAVGEMNASIKDRYFTSACASPASVFPILLRLSQHHITKAEYGHTSDRRIEKILDLLDVEANPIPSRLTLDEQGIFVLGYYHQRAAFYKKNEQPEVNHQNKI